MHSEMQAHVCFHLHFDMSGLHAGHLRNYSHGKTARSSEETTEARLRDQKWKEVVQHVSVQMQREICSDPAGTKSEILLIYIFNHSN